MPACTCNTPLKPINPPRAGRFRAALTWTLSAACMTGPGSCASPNKNEHVNMKQRDNSALQICSTSLLFLPFAAQAASDGFIDGASATLQARTYYFSRDYSDIVGANQQSKAEEWAQGFILNIKSGYTPGAVGFGLDAQGLLGIKLDSSRDRVNTGLLPVADD